MRFLALIPFVFILNAQSAERDFSGSWRLNVAQSNIRETNPPPATIEVRQTADSLVVSKNAQQVNYPLNGKSAKSRVGDESLNSVTKWEGSALLVNTIVSGPTDYSTSERWERSRDGNRLTITRTVMRRSGETESTLVYESPNAPVTAARPVAPLASREPQPPPKPDDYVVRSGTRILLRLTNSVDTKRSAPGDHVYLQTAVPVFVNGRAVIPKGSYVNGTITESQRAGKVKGKAALNLTFDSLTLANGVTRDFHSRPGSMDSRGNLDRTEGRIEGEGNAGGDTKKVATTTAAGASVGTIAGAAAGHIGTGLGIGSAAGAIAGLAGVLGSRGPDVVIQPGTMMELVLDRDLVFSAAELPGR